MARQTVSAEMSLLSAGNRLAIVVDLDQHDGLDIAVLADRLPNGVGRVQLYALALQRRDEGLVAAYGGGHLHDSGYLDTPGQRHPGGVEAQVAGAHDHHAPRAGSLVSIHEHEGAVGPHRARQIPPREGDAQVPGAGCHDEPVILHQPRPLVVGQAELRTVENPAGFRIAKGTPDTRPKLDVDAGFFSLRQSFVGRSHPLQHQSLVSQRTHETLAEELRNIQPDHGS